MKTSNKDFVYFKKCCEKWMRYFGILHYEIYFSHELLESESEETSIVSKAYWDIEGRSVVFYFNTELDEKMSYKEINRSAFHEVCHVLLGDIHVYAQSRFIDEVALKGAIHSVIRVLENTLLTH